MAKKPRPPEEVKIPEVERNIDESMRDSVGELPLTKKTPAPKQPVYQVIGSSKIPVAKSHGKLWKARKLNAEQERKKIVEAWEEATRYYLNDQMAHRGGGDDLSVNNEIGNQRLNRNITETENIVFANIHTVVPILYARNPRAEFTATDPNNEELRRHATLVERLVNVLAAKKAAPGLNLKPKAKRCVVTALLTNRAWLEIGWTQRQESDQAVLDTISDIAEKLAKAKEQKEIIELEGRLMALEDVADVVEVPGPSLRFRHPKDVLVDPSAQEIDGSDAKWMMVRDCLPTAYLNARYGKRDNESGEVKSIYEPSHVLKMTGENDEDKTFSLFDTGKDHTSYGFDDPDSFRKSQYTEVWFVWDKVTRRVLMYVDKDWSWPVWVWDDPLRLDQFFPLYPLVFYESPCGQHTIGEVTYYLDQQDAINEMVDEERRARRWARRNLFYDKNRISEADVNAVLNGPDGNAKGIDVPEGMKVTDLIFAITPPSLQFKELFNKDEKLRAIERISSVSEALRGAQFKTNTTNKAVEANMSAAMVRNDEKEDQIEDWIGAVLWGIAQLCLQFMTKEEVAVHIGDEAGQAWENMTPDEIRRRFSVQVVGGSAKKPTSAAKKEEAIQLGQVLGQFVQASPVVVLVMLRMLEQAFDEIVIREEDWQKISQSIEASIQGQQQEAVETPTAALQGAQGGQPTAQQPQGGGVDQQKLDELLSMLPEDAKRRIVQAIRSGTDPKTAIANEVRQLQ